MHARVAGQVWLPRRDLDPRLINYFREKLTIVPRKLGDYDNDVPPEPVLLYSETHLEFGVPRAFWFSTARGHHTYDWDTSEGQPIELESRIKHDGPYVEQAEAVEAFERKFWDSMTCASRNWDDKRRGLNLGGILQGKTGFGKTQVALELIKRLGRTALIVVHKDFLMRQWSRRIEEFLPGARVGIVREERCDFEDKDIVIAMAQSLAMDNGRGGNGGRYPRGLYRWPGVLVLDEVHRVGAPTWSPIPPRFDSAFRLGLTARPKRKDGADRVFWDHLGQVAFVAKTQMPEPAIRMLYFYMPSCKSSLVPAVRDRDAKSGKVEALLPKIGARNAFVVDEIIKALRGKAQRKIMVLSNRLDHLRRLDGILAEHPDTPKGVVADFYVGEWYTGEKVMKLSKRTWSMKGEGREAAIKAIYSSLSRRKGWHGEIKKLPVQVELQGPFLIDECSAVPGRLVQLTTKRGKPITVKVHVVAFSGDYVNGLKGDYENLEDAEVDVVLEDLADDELFRVAKDWNVAQRPKEKTRPRTEEELDQAEQARVIWATYQMCSEGIDLPAVDTIIFATPSGDVEQAIGRGRRFCVPERHGGTMTPAKCEHFCPWRAAHCQGKADLVVGDVCDIGVPLSAKRERWRASYYRSEGFKVAS